MEITNSTLATAFKASGLTQAAFCKENGISLERLRYHLYKKSKTLTSANYKRSAKKSIPAFISFDNSLKASTVNQSESFNVTIIQGRFTPQCLSSLLRELNKSC